jgi:hypothetical protein
LLRIESFLCSTAPLGRYITSASNQWINHWNYRIINKYSDVASIDFHSFIQQTLQCCCCQHKDDTDDVRENKKHVNNFLESSTTPLLTDTKSRLNIYWIDTN